VTADDISSFLSSIKHVRYSVHDIRPSVFPIWHSTSILFRQSISTLLGHRSSYPSYSLNSYLLLFSEPFMTSSDSATLTSKLLLRSSTALKKCLGTNQTHSHLHTAYIHPNLSFPGQGLVHLNKRLLLCRFFPILITYYSLCYSSSGHIFLSLTILASTDDAALHRTTTLPCSTGCSNCTEGSP
jgi:hypothetical protein